MRSIEEQLSFIRNERRMLLQSYIALQKEFGSTGMVKLSKSLKDRLSLLSAIYHTLECVEQRGLINDQRFKEKRAMEIKEKKPVSHGTHTD